jgi:ribosomal-protein-alanine N-acetyltransferase
MLRFMPSDEKPCVENYAIFLREPLNSAESGKPRMIGTIGATRVLPDEDAIELSYGLPPSFWGRGYIREALGKFIKLYWALNSMTPTFLASFAIIHF